MADEELNSEKVAPRVFMWLKGLGIVWHHWLLQGPVSVWGQTFPLKPQQKEGKRFITTAKVYF